MRFSFYITPLLRRNKTYSIWTQLTAKKHIPTSFLCHLLMQRCWATQRHKSRTGVKVRTHLASFTHRLTRRRADPEQTESQTQLKGESSCLCWCSCNEAVYFIICAGALWVIILRIDTDHPDIMAATFMNINTVIWLIYQPRRFERLSVQSRNAAVHFIRVKHCTPNNDINAQLTSHWSFKNDTVRGDVRRNSTR